jgi:hypothetical protein
LEAIYWGEGFERFWLQAKEGNFWEAYTPGEEANLKPL